MAPSDDAFEALLDYGSNVRDEHDADYWPALLPRLREIAAGGSLRADDSEELRWHVEAVRDGRYFDANVREPADSDLPWISIDTWERPELLDELRAITFDADAGAAAFILKHVWPWGRIA